MQVPRIFRLAWYSLWILILPISLPWSGAQQKFYSYPNPQDRYYPGEVSGRTFGIIGEFFHQWGCNIKAGLFGSPCNPPPRPPPPRPPPRPPPPPPRPPPRPPPPPPVQYVPRPVPVPVPVPNPYEVPVPVPVPTVIYKYIPVQPPPAPPPPWVDPRFLCCTVKGRNYCNSPMCYWRGRKDLGFFRFQASGHVEQVPRLIV